jgi:NAD(P)-dependent dehydrogenase (short-subunit alcohol dehydrogenase family)
MVEDSWFHGKVAAITGGASGIGRGIALKLAASGTNVVIADVAGDNARSVLGEIRGAGAEGLALHIDVSREDDATRMVSSALSQFGRLDFLVNCAGNSHLATVAEMPLEAWKGLLDVHLTGTFLCSRAAIDALLETGGRIVNLSSNYGFKGRANGSHYAAAKAGIAAFTKALAVELAPRVNANAIAPGPIDTPRWRAGLPDEAYEAKKARRVTEIPLGRMGQPGDIAEAAHFLLGPGSAWVTGQVLHVNGGEFMP